MASASTGPAGRPARLVAGSVASLWLAAETVRSLARLAPNRRAALSRLSSRADGGCPPSRPKPRLPDAPHWPVGIYMATRDAAATLAAEPVRVKQHQVPSRALQTTAARPPAVTRHSRPPAVTRHSRPSFGSRAGPHLAPPPHWPVRVCGFQVAGRMAAWVGIEPHPSSHSPPSRPENA